MALAGAEPGQGWRRGRRGTRSGAAAGRGAEAWLGGLGAGGLGLTMGQERGLGQRLVLEVAQNQGGPGPEGA